MVKIGLNIGWRNLLGFLTHPPVFVRSLYAETLLEDFFVSAVTSVLALRLYLHITGFPQIGFGVLHIAHILWGGLLLLIALIILLAFLDHGAKVIAAILGGIGFGVFIDELGKFITSDNDYFFQPTVALIYIIFVIIFFIIRAIGKHQFLSNQERLANAFYIATQGSLIGLDQVEQNNVSKLLEGYDMNPVLDNLKLILQNTQVVPPRPSRPLARIRDGLDRFYEWAVTKWWFNGVIIAFFAFTALTSIFSILALVDWPLSFILWVIAGGIILVTLVWSRQFKIRHLYLTISVAIVIISILIGWTVIGNLNVMAFSIIDWAQFVFPSMSGLFIATGMVILPRNRLQGYLMFRRAILISIFFTQVMSFYEQQLLALLGLFLNILILISLRYMIAHEDVKRRNHHNL